MKNTFFLLVIFLSSFLAKGQEYVPFNFDNGEWYCKYITKGGMFNIGHGTYYATDSVKFFCKGDTLINDTLYKKLYYEGNSSSQLVEKTYISGYYGAIRNDTLKKQIWSYIGNTSFLIYDFNLINGDSICNTLQYPMPVTFNFCGKIKAIDSVSYCNKYFKRYTINDEQSIIEGIGSDQGLFPVKSKTWYSSLICYKEKNNCESCKIIFTNIKNHSINESTIYLNQSNNKLHISSENKIESIEMVDLYGRYIINAKNLNCNSLDFLMTYKGICIAKVKANDKIFIRKIIIK